jgi:hypothetical protein
MRLQDVSATEFAAIVVDAAKKQILRVEERWRVDLEKIELLAGLIGAKEDRVVVSPGTVQIREFASDTTPLFLEAQLLHRYANGVERLPSSEVLGLLNTLRGIVDQVSASELWPASWRIDHTPDDIITIVAKASLARLNIARAQPVPRHCLACVAGVDSSRIRQEIKAKKLTACVDPIDGKACVTWDSAMRWLEQRGN